MYLLEKNINRRGIPEAILVFVCIFSFFIHNGVIYPDSMESQNLVSAREMAESGDWLSPTVNGVLNFEKPPLPIWISACIEKLSPDNLVLHRCFAGLMATLMALFVYFLTAFQTKSRFIGLAAGIIFSTSINTILISRMAIWDIYCHSFMLGAILCFIHGYEQRGKNHLWFISAGALIGLSFLSKGPVAIYSMLIPFFIAYFSVFRRSCKEVSGEHKFYPIVLMIITACAIGLWWPVAAYMHHPAEFIASGKAVVMQWFTDRVRPWYYYWNFFVESGLWCIFFLMSLNIPYWYKFIGHKRHYLSSAVWCLTGLLLLSLIPEKNPRYLLPLLVPMSQMTAFLLHFWGKCAKDHFFPDKTKRYWHWNSWLLSILVLISPISNFFVLYRTEMIPLNFYLISSALLFIIGAFLLVCAMKKYIFGFCYCILFFIACVSVYILPSIADLFSVLNKNGFDRISEIEELHNVPFYCDENESIRVNLIYETRKNITPIAFDKQMPQPPFAVIHHTPIESIIPQEKLNTLKKKEIGQFNDNYRIEREIQHDDNYYKTITLFY